MRFDTSTNNSQSGQTSLWRAGKRAVTVVMLSQHLWAVSSCLALVEIKEERLTVGFGAKPEDILVPL